MALCDIVIWFQVVTARCMLSPNYYCLILDQNEIYQFPTVDDATDTKAFKAWPTPCTKFIVVLNPHDRKLKVNPINLTFRQIFQYLLKVIPLVQIDLQPDY